MSKSVQMEKKEFPTASWAASNWLLSDQNLLLIYQIFPNGYVQGLLSELGLTA